MNSDSLEETFINGQSIPSFNIGGEMRLVIGGVIKQTLGSFHMEQIFQALDKLLINMTPATNQQISALKRAGVIAMTFTQCPLISKKDAERLIAYLNANSGQVNFCNAETYFDFNVQKFGDSMNYQLMIPKDLLDGIAPLKITDDSKELWKFYQVLDFMAHEKQVLILIDTDNIYGFAFRSLRQRLPKGSFIEHHRHKQNEIAATAWALDLQKPNTMKDPNQKKYLIGDWFSSAGFEAPAVIFITKYQDAANNATFCQRAKAKLVIYHVPKVKIYHHDVSNPIHSYHASPPMDSMGNLIRTRDINCYSCGEIKPGIFSICMKDKVWTVIDLQGYDIKDFLKPSQIQHLIDNSPPPCQGTKKSETNQPQKKIKSINESESHSESNLDLDSDSESYSDSDSESESESELNMIRNPDTESESDYSP